MYELISDSPAETIRRGQLISSLGVKLAPPELWAVNAAVMLGRVLRDRYVCEEWKRELPLAVLISNQPPQPV
jgi:hypothetical protein